MSSPASAEDLEKFRVVLLYDRLASAGRAMVTYGHLAHALEDDFKPDLRIWRMDTASAPEFSDQAAEDLNAAELIVIAVGADEPCPPAFRHWLDGVDASGNPHPHGVIALVGPAEKDDAGDSTWDRVLHGVGTEIHPGVFVCEPAAAQAEDALLSPVGA